MKRILNILLITNIVLFGGMIEIEKLYNEGEYQKAIDEAKALTEDYSNPKLHLLWANSAEALGNKEEAMSAYERVLFYDSENTEVRLKLVEIYKNMSKDILASEMTESLQNYALTASQRNTLNLLNQENIDSFTATAALMFGYDDNLNINPDFYSPLNPNAENLASNFLAININLSYINEIEDKGGWYFRTDASLYNQNNFSEDYYNLTALKVGAGLGFKAKEYSLYVPLTYSYLNYIEKDLLYTLGCEPQINVNVSNSLILNFNAVVKQTEYIQISDFQSNDFAYGAGMGGYLFFNKNFIYANINYEGRFATTIEPTRFTNREGIISRLGANLNVGDYFDFRLDYKYAFFNYADSLVGSNDLKRIDHYYQTDVKITKMISDNVEIYGSYNYIYSNSNFLFATYQKNIPMLGLQYNY